MRTFSCAALAVVFAAAATTAPVLAADLLCDPYGNPGGVPCDPPDYPEIEYRDPGNFYLRGSAALNMMWAREVVHTPEYAALGGTLTVPIDGMGYGYSWGVGFGYETGTGLRVDFTIDQLENNGLHMTKAFGNGVDVDGQYSLSLRSTLALANVYYDMYFDSLGGDLFGSNSPGSGMFGYVGAGVGAAFNRLDATVVPSTPGVTFNIPYGTNVSPAAAVMAGVGVDMGSWTADVGYRGIWIRQLANTPITTPGLQYSIDNPLIHEVRGTVRYRIQ